LLNWYRPRVKHAFLLDFLLEPRVEGNTSIVRADLEMGIPMPDASVDMVTSVSSVEHLSGEGQVLFFREAQRVLRPGGIAALTVSYLLGLNDHALQVLSTNWSRFPGYDGFSEQNILADRDIILDTVHVDPALKSASEVNSLQIRWAEIGIFLVKSPGEA
jgi:SAM-dependent methyltransferase